MQVTSGFLAECVAAVNANPELTVSVDLADQMVSIPGVGEEMFEINPYKKECLMKGYDDIDYLLANIDEIIKFENRYES